MKGISPTFLPGPKHKEKNCIHVQKCIQQMYLLK
jgi:hypothetical protein